jgi:hypothetical protein
VIILEKILTNVKGVKGVPTLGCLPLWGREGVTLITPQRSAGYILNMRISPEQIFLY